MQSNSIKDWTKLLFLIRIIKNVNESLIKKEKKKYNKPNLIYNGLSFYSYSDDKKFVSVSFKSKYSYLLSFYDDFQKLIKMKSIKLDKIKEKEKVHNAVSKLYNKSFEINMMNIINYQMLKRISAIKKSILKT